MNFLKISFIVIAFIGANKVAFAARAMQGPKGADAKKGHTHSKKKWKSPFDLGSSASGLDVKSHSPFEMKAFESPFDIGIDESKTSSDSTYTFAGRKKLTPYQEYVKSKKRFLKSRKANTDVNPLFQNSYQNYSNKGSLYELYNARKIKKAQKSSNPNAPKVDSAYRFY